MSQAIVVILVIRNFGVSQILSYLITSGQLRVAAKEAVQKTSLANFVNLIDGEKE